MTHTVALVSDFLVPGWMAECSCGWASPRRAEISAAHADFADHAERAMATPMPALAEPSYPSCRLPGCQEPARTSTGFSSESCEERYFDMARDAEEEQ